MTRNLSDLILIDDVPLTRAEARRILAGHSPADDEPEEDDGTDDWEEFGTPVGTFQAGLERLLASL